MLNRRDILKLSAGAAAGAAFAPGIASARDDEHDGSGGGLYVAAATGDQQTEPIDTDAQGLAIFSLSEDGTELEYSLAVNNIEDATMAHIHLAPPGTDGPIVVWLYPSPDAEEPELQEGRFDGVLATDTITAEHLTEDIEGDDLDALVQEIDDGNTYVNVHTEANPGGEIRGQIMTVDDAISALMDAKMEADGEVEDNETDMEMNETDEVNETDTNETDGDGDGDGDDGDY